MSFFETTYTFKKPKTSTVVTEAIRAVFPQFSLIVQGNGTQNTFTIRTSHPILDWEKEKILDILQELDKTATDWQKEYTQAKEQDAAEKTYENRLAVIARILGLEE